MPRFPTLPTLALLGSLLCLVACAPTATVRVPPTLTATAPVTPTTAPSPTPAPDWQGFTDPKFGFTVAVPGVFSLDPSVPLQQISTDSTTSFVYLGSRATPPSPTPSVFAPYAELEIYASTAPHECVLQGMPVPVGQGTGITGYRYDTFTFPFPSGGSHAVGGGVSFVVGGLYVYLFLVASGYYMNRGDYWAALGSTWQHILASFVPGHPLPQGIRAARPRLATSVRRDASELWTC